MNKVRKPQKKFTHIGEVLQQTLLSCRPETNETLATLGGCWSEVVGEVLGANSCPAAMKGKQLLVHVNNPVWLQEFRFLKVEVMEAANRMLGRPLVQDIKVKVGKV